MDTSNPLPPGSTGPAHASLHPLLKIAAVFVIAACVVAIWAMTTRTRHSDADAQQAAATAEQGVAPVAEQNAASAAAEPAPVAAPVAEASAPAAPAVVAPKPAAKPAPAKKTSVASNNATPAPYQPAPIATPAPPPPAPQVDPNRGRVEDVTVTEQRGDAKGVGAVAGGVVGGLLGNQIGRGGGRTAATVLGAVGGAVAGHQIEKTVRTVKTWHVRVRMDDGSTRSFTQETEPVWHAGESVRVVDGRLAYPDGTFPAVKENKSSNTAPPSLNTDTRG